MRFNALVSRRARAWPVLIPLSILIAFFLPALNQGWYHTDAGLYAALALGGWESPPGSLFPLTLGGEPYFNKPPLAFWIYGLPMTLLGSEIWVPRLASLVAGAGALIFFFDLTRRLAGTRAALLAAIIFATTLEFFRYMHTISLDLWLLFFEFLFVWGIIRATFDRQSSRRTRAASTAVAGAALGCALLVKPFIALICPLLIAAWLIVERKPRALVSLFAAVLISLVLAAPWHIAMVLTYGQAFTSEYFLGQTLNRALSDAHGAAPWHYYLRLIAQSYWPWLIALAASVFVLLRSGFDDRAARAQRFALIWAGAWLIILSLASDKAGRYLMPFWPAAAMFCGTTLIRFLPRSRHPFARAVNTCAVPITLLIGLTIALIPGINFHHPINPKKKTIFDAVVEIQNAAPADEPAPRLWVTPGAHRLRADAFIAINQWAGIAPDADSLATNAESPAAVPAPGDLMIVRNSTRIGPRPSDEVVVTNDQFTAVRISSPWDGRLTIDESAREPID